jgi:uncharacterized protein
MPMHYVNSSTLDADAVIAATRSWLQRAVIGLNLCPFAKAVDIKQQIRYVVSAAQSTTDLSLELERELGLLAAADSEAIDTTLLIHPLVLRDFLDYNDFLPRVDAVVMKLGFEGVLQVASFHPDYEFADSAADDMANFSNRSPYAMLHLLREASIDRAVAAFPDASIIFERNIQTLRALGHAGWQRLWTDGE